MRTWWQVFPKALTPQECAALVRYAQDRAPAREATVGHGGTTTVNADLRRSKVRWLDRHDYDLQRLFARLGSLGREANARAFGFDLADFHEVQFTEYGPGEFYGEHEDNCWVPAPGKELPFDRKLTMVMQLTPRESYTGGGLWLDRSPLGEDQFRDAGDVIFFPSFLRHRAEPVTDGVRHSLVTWFTGPPFR